MENMHVTEYIQWEPSAFECFSEEKCQTLFGKTYAFILF